jgi:hypothetical protein
MAWVSAGAMAVALPAQPDSPDPVLHGLFALLLLGMLALYLLAGRGGRPLLRLLALSTLALASISLVLLQLEPWLLFQLGIRSADIPAVAEMPRGFVSLHGLALLLLGVHWILVPAGGPREARNRASG